MTIKPQINAILNKEMDRQDFLKHVAIGIVALTGAGAALRLLSNDKPAQHVAVNSGYGGSAYGGGQENSKQTV